MMDYKINQQERMALRGSPHLQQLTYLVAIRPYMDFANGSVGIKRKISYQSIKEELFVEPHVGYKSHSPSRDQIKRALKGLARAGLLEIKSINKQLIVQCLLATTDKSTQNKAATKPSREATHSQSIHSSGKSNDFVGNHPKPAPTVAAKAATPPGSGNNIILSSQPSTRKFTHEKNKSTGQRRSSPTEILWQSCSAGLRGSDFE